MRNTFTEAVRSVQDREHAQIVIAYVVSAKIEASGDVEAVPMQVQFRSDDGAPFNIVKNISSFDPTDVAGGDMVLIGRIGERRWIGLGKVE